MKKLSILGTLLMILSATYTIKAQVQILNEMSITPPTFQHERPENLSEYFQKTIEYPSNSLNSWMQGTEVVRFSVSVDGTVENIQVINSVSDEIDREVIAALKNTSGHWKPGIIDGEVSPMTREIALAFVMVSYKDMQNTARNYVMKGNTLMFSKQKPEKAIKYYDLAYTMFPYDTGVLAARDVCLKLLGRADEEISADLPVIYPPSVDPELIVLSYASMK